AVTFDARHDIAVTEGDARGTRTFVLRWDSAGTPTLDRAYEGTSEQMEILYDTAGAKKGDLFLVGSGFFGGGGALGEGPAYVALLDPTGEPQWVKRFASQTLTHVAVSPDGQVITTGLEATGPEPQNPAPSELAATAAKLTRTGVAVWTRNLGP